MADVRMLLDIQQVTDAHPGTVPAITGGGRVFVSNEDGTAGAWTPTDEVGAVGPAGADGRTLHNGTGAPSNGLGADGDFYMDVSDPAEVTLYGPKAAGAWPAGIVLNGDPGPAGADGVMNAPADPGEDFFIPYADGGDLTYNEDFQLSSAGGMLLRRNTLAATAVVLHLQRRDAATIVSPVQRSPAIELEASSLDTGSNTATVQAYRTQVIPTAGATPFSSLVIEHNSGSGHVNAARFTGSIFGLWDGAAWQDVANAIGGTVYFCPSAAPAQFGGSLEVTGNFACNGASPAPPVNVTGSRGGNAALASLLTALAAAGLITDGTTA